MTLFIDVVGVEFRHHRPSEPGTCTEDQQAVHRLAECQPRIELRHIGDGKIHKINNIHIEMNNERRCLCGSTSERISSAACLARPLDAFRRMAHKRATGEYRALSHPPDCPDPDRKRRPLFSGSKERAGPDPGETFGSPRFSEHMGDAHEIKDPFRCRSGRVQIPAAIEVQQGYIGSMMEESDSAPTVIVQSPPMIRGVCPAPGTRSTCCARSLATWITSARFCAWR